MKNQIILKTLIISAGFLTSFSAANAISFDNILTDGGTLSYDGNTVTGENLVFDTITGSGIVINSFINFETGISTGTNANNGLTFAAGGSLSMSGTIDFDKDGTVDYDGTIFSGTFGESLLFIDSIPGLGAFQMRFMTTGSNSDTIVYSQELLEALGYDSQFFDFGLTVIASGSGVVRESDAALRSTGVSVSSTGSTVTMLGMGLTIIGLVARRKK